MLRIQVLRNVPFMMLRSDARDTRLHVVTAPETTGADATPLRYVELSEADAEHFASAIAQRRAVGMLGEAIQP